MHIEPIITRHKKVLLIDAYGTLFSTEDGNPPVEALAIELAARGHKPDMVLLAHALKLEMHHYRAKQRSVKTREALKLLRFECAAIIVRELRKSENFNLEIG